MSRFKDVAATAAKFAAAALVVAAIGMPSSASAQMAGGVQKLHSPAPT